MIRPLAIAIFLSGYLCAGQGDAPLRLEKSADAMGSTYTVTIYGTNRVVMEDAADAALDEARRLDNLLSNYKKDSELSQVNEHAAQAPVKISPELFHLLARCLD